MRRRVLILEGTCGAGKSTLLKRLSETTQVGSVWTQKTTYGPIVLDEDKGTLDDSLNFSILQRLTMRLEDELQQQNRGLVLDTFHITQYLRPGVLTKKSFTAIDQKLESLGARIVFLTMSKDDIAERTILQRKHTGFFNYIQKYGSTVEQLVEYFSREQEQMKHVLKELSCLPVTLIPESASVEMRCHTSLELLNINTTI